MNIHKFILDVKKFPEMYDKSDLNYMNTAHKEAIWDKISSVHNCEAKKKWNAIRDKYVRERKKQYRNITTGKFYKCNWQHFSILKFLDNYIKSKEVKTMDLDFSKKIDIVTMSQNSWDSAMEKDDDVETQNDIFTEITEENQEPFDFQYVLDTPETEEVEEIEQTNQPKADSETFEDEFVKTLQLIQDVLKRKNDDDDDFLNMIKKKMTKMTPRNKSTFQVEIFAKAEELLNAQNTDKFVNN